MDPNLPKTINEVQKPLPSHSLGQKIIMFGLPTCPHCKRVKEFFAKHKIDYEYHDVAEESKGRDWVTSFVDFVPVIVLQDGSLMYGPDDDDLAQELGIDSHLKSL